MKSIIGLHVMLCCALFGGGYSTKADWLVDLNDTASQMQAIQKQLRGFDTAMAETGVRYEATKAAIHQGNYPLARYHWEKLKVAIDNGTIRRPARKDAAQSYFLEPVWPQVDAALRSGDAKRIQKSFEPVKAVCNACHVDQKVGFIVVE